ncbi:MAG TPA: VWA domain-containing protein, partial [Lacipirellulaceae bacterium]|nr:VWA domain-containing protein [Lacipirellulaceae bacterium]
MRTRRSLTVSLASIASVAATLGVAHGAAAAESARLTTYSANGQTSYALSVAAEPAPEIAAVDVVVLFDTSASQQGPYRDSALTALQAMIQGMRPSDRVQILAVDLDAAPLMAGFAPAGSPEVAQAIAALRQRAPLGSTNLVLGLQAAVDRLEEAKSPRRAITYIGDGVSMANMLDAATLRPLVDRLRATRTPVSSYAIGPEVDGQILAVLANQTGGNLYAAEALTWADDAAGVTVERADSENARAAAAVGKHLSAWTRVAVEWPVAAQLPDALGQTYPSPVPPLRADRDTVIVGRTSAPLSGAVNLQITVAGGEGQSRELSWQVAPEAASQDNAFLGELVDAAARDGGLTLPTVGTAGLAEAARLAGARADQLAMLAERAVASGDRASAARIANAVLRTDPGNVQARTVQAVIEAPAPAGAPGLVEPLAPGAAPLVAPPAPASGDIILQGPPPGAGPMGGPRTGAFLDEVEQERRAFQQMLEADISNTIIAARARMGAEPVAVVQELKLALE